jgi:ATP-dependent Clp protease adaptor protein ClpS
MTFPAFEPEIANADLLGERWMVVIFNNDTTPADAVLLILMQATKCDAEEAYMEMWEAHTFGKASVHFAPLAECEAVAELIETVGVKTEVKREWDE